MVKRPKFPFNMLLFPASQHISQLLDMLPSPIAEARAGIPLPSQHTN
jgi:hypothetical protein